MKKRLLALLLASTFAVSGCDFSNPDPLGPLPEPSYFQKEGTNILKFEWLNVPEEGILRGCFDDYNIALKIYYEDNTDETIPLKMKDIPRQYRHILNEVGDHILTILFRGEELVVHFKILPSDKTFSINYYDYRGNLIAHFDAEPEDIIDVPSPVSRLEDIEFIYHWKSWSDDLTGLDIYQDYEIYPIYESEFKRSCGTTSRYSYYTGDHQVLHSDRDGDYSVTYIHLGRITNAPLYIAKLHENADLSDAGFDSYHHDGSVDKTLYAEFEIDKTQISKELKKFFERDTYYQDDSSSHPYSHYFHGEWQAQANVAPANYSYKGKCSDHDYNELIGGVTKSVLDHGDGKTEVVDLYKTYIEDDIEELLENKEVVGNKFVEPFVINESSNTGYYRAIYTADVDITMALKARVVEEGYTKELWLETASGDYSPYSPDIYFTVDPVRSRVKMDYHKTDSGFPATSGRKLNYDYTGIAGDAYYGVFGE